MTKDEMEEELERLRDDRARLLQILSEICVALDLCKEELGEMIQRAKDDDSLPEDFYLGLYPPEAKK